MGWRPLRREPLRSEQLERTFSQNEYVHTLQHLLYGLEFPLVGLLLHKWERDTAGTLLPDGGCKVAFNADYVLHLSKPS